VIQLQRGHGYQLEFCDWPTPIYSQKQLLRLVLVYLRDYEESQFDQRDDSHIRKMDKVLLLREEAESVG
jgi:hypothetical protein